MRNVILFLTVLLAQAVFAEETPPPKPQTYLYEWYSPFSGVKTWSGEPPDYSGNIQPKTVCVWQESNSLGCFNYALPESKELLRNKATLQKQQTAAWETYKVKEAADKEEKEHKELMASESGEMRSIRDKARARDIQRISMGIAQTVADKIVEIAELSPLAQKYLSSGLLNVATITISRINIVSMGVTTPKTHIEKLLSSSEPADKTLGERAQAAVAEMGVSLFTGNDTDVAKGIMYHVAQYISALELTRKSPAPKTQ